MLKKILILLFIICFVVLSNIDISYQNIEIDEYIEVEIRGELKNPGIFKIKRGSSFNELLPELILTDDADLSSISLLKKLKYQDIIVIPTKKEETKISINSASLKELIELPNIGEKTAEKIIEYREKNGGFKSIEEIQNVSGIKSKTFDKIKDLITL